MRPSLARMLSTQDVGAQTLLHSLATAILHNRRDECIAQIKREIAEKKALLG